MIRVAYPNEGIYAEGKPRLEQVNAKGEIVFCREATPGEALIFGVSESLDSLRYAVDTLNQQIRDVQTYGLRTNR